MDALGEAGGRSGEARAAMHHGAKHSGVQKRRKADFVDTRRTYRHRTKFPDNRSSCDSPGALYGNVFQHSRCFGNVQARIASTGTIAPFVISSMIRLMM